MLPSANLLTHIWDRSLHASPKTAIDRVTMVYMVSHYMYG